MLMPAHCFVVNISSWGADNRWVHGSVFRGRRKVSSEFFGYRESSSLKFIYQTTISSQLISQEIFLPNWKQSLCGRFQRSPWPCIWVFHAHSQDRTQRMIILFLGSLGRWDSKQMLPAKRSREPVGRKIMWATWEIITYGCYNAVK